MKNVLFLSVACWLGAMKASAIDWTLATNIAQGCDVTVSSNFDRKANVVDGNLGSGWQAQGGLTTADYTRGNDWLLIDLGGDKTIADIEVIQEAARAARYDMYLLSEAPTIVDVSENEKKVDADWLAAQMLLYQHDESAEPGTGVAIEGRYHDLHHLDTPASGQYLLLYSTEYDAAWAGQYGIQIFEVLVSEYSADYDKVSTISLDNLEILQDETGEVAVVPYTMGGNPATSFDGVENLTLTVNDPEAANITGGENGSYLIEGLKLGRYTLTATATINGETKTATATLDIQYNWNGVKNVALNKGAYASHNQEKTGLSVDGDLNTRWELGEPTMENTWYYVDLGGVYKISAIAPVWQTAYASHYKYYTATELGEDNEPVWTELVEIQKMLDQAERYTDTYVPDEAVEARYVKLACIKSEVWGMSFYEFMVAGEPATVPVPAEILLEANVSTLMSGESATLTAVIKDDYANFMEDVAPVLEIVEGEGELDGNTFTATRKGVVKIQASYGDLAPVTVELDVLANAADKITMAGAEVTADAGDPSQAVDGNKGSLWVTGEGEAQGAEVEHWIQLELPYAYDLDAITLSWEGACPADYKVYVGTDAESATEIYAVEGHAGMASYTDLIAADAKEVSFIKVVTTKNATGYGIKLFELELYGQLSDGQFYTRKTSFAHIGTICLPFAAVLEGADAYAMTGKTEDNSAIIMDPVEKMEAGVPYFFYACSDRLTAIPQSGVAYEAKNVNGLYGTFEDIADDRLMDKYVMTDHNSFQQCVSGSTLYACQAYINLNEVPVATPREYSIVLLLPGHTTGIENADLNATGLVDVYTLGGVRVRSQVPASKATEGLSSGIYIVNGKKYVVR